MTIAVKFLEIKLENKQVSCVENPIQVCLIFLFDCSICHICGIFLTLQGRNEVRIIVVENSFYLDS